MSVCVRVGLLVYVLLLSCLCSCSFKCVCVRGCVYLSVCV